MNQDRNKELHIASLNLKDLVINLFLREERTILAGEKYSKEDNLEFMKLIIKQLNGVKTQFENEGIKIKSTEIEINIIKDSKGKLIDNMADTIDELVEEIQEKNDYEKYIKDEILLVVEKAIKTVKEIKKQYKKKIK